MTVAVEHYAMTRDCWLAGQISDAEMHKLMADDHLFRTWFMDAVKRAMEAAE